MAAFLLQARDKSIALTLRTVAEDDGQASVGGNGPSAGGTGGVGMERMSSMVRMESGLNGLELDPRYQMIGDGSRLGQVLRNLLSNAIKFTNAGGTVTVIVERVPGGMPGHVHIVLPEEQRGLLSYPRAGSVRISVVDSGAGLSEQQLLDIGQEGLQFNASALQGGGGSGLGIFISKGLVLQHGGLMTVTSPGLGRGVSTTLEFPLFEAVVDDDEFPQPLADTEQQQAEVGALGPGEDYLRDYRIQAAPVVKLGAGASRGSAYLLPEAGQDIPPSIKIPVTLAVTPAASASEIEISSLSRSASPITTPFMSVKIPAFGSASTSPSASALSVVSPSHAPPKRYMLVVDDATSNRKLLVRIFKIKVGSEYRGVYCTYSFLTPPLPLPYIHSRDLSARRRATGRSPCRSTPICAHRARPQQPSSWISRCRCSTGPAPRGCCGSRAAAHSSWASQATW
ncbi:histidine kinase-like ATPase [Ochromonadaceae sp. CCMP2298]|nr:histidine kinase-like ATPase [Ochromonadaceae sp. CCMP2298]